MKLTSIIIEGSAAKRPLAGLRYWPEGTPKPIAVALAHGFTSAKHSMDGLAAYLADRGFECVTFDAVGHKLGCTAGEMHRISQSADNLKQTVAWMRSSLHAPHPSVSSGQALTSPPSGEEFGFSRIAIIGHSMGAAAAIQVAAWENGAPDASTPLAGIACLCMGVNPTAGFSTPLGAAMLAQRSDYVSGAPAADLLAGLDAMLDAAGDVAPLPALLIAAKSDVLLPVKSVELLAERIGPHAEMRAIEAMHLDAPDRARAIILRWLDSL